MAPDCTRIGPQKNLHDCGSWLRHFLSNEARAVPLRTRRGGGETRSIGQQTGLLLLQRRDRAKKLAARQDARPAVHRVPASTLHDGFVYRSGTGR